MSKIIAKKRSRYPDDKKLMQYLARQGFSYDDIKKALDQ
jgi:regulatory protein